MIFATITTNIPYLFVSLYITLVSEWDNVLYVTGWLKQEFR